jgi:hypothetical protein
MNHTEYSGCCLEKSWPTKAISSAMTGELVLGLKDSVRPGSRAKAAIKRRRAARPGRAGLGPHRRLRLAHECRRPANPPPDAAIQERRHPPFHGRRKPNGSACRRRTMAGVQHEAAISPLKSCEVEKPQPQERAGIGSTRRASCNIATWLVALGVKRFPVSPSAFPSARPPLAIVCRVRRGLF